MRNVLVAGLGILCILTSCREHTTSVKEEDQKGKEISFYTPDTIKILGDLYEIDKNATTILLFHQGGSNARGEYHTIIPTLIDKGYNVLAIDQRRGGQTYGNYNRTVANIVDNNFNYCDAYSDLEGALDYMINAGFSGKKLLWGSSYSASLAIQLAYKRPEDVDGVLAFSPASGGPMQACRPDVLLETLTVPLLLVRPAKEMEIESVKNQFNIAQQNKHQTYVAKHGVHGSSMLVDTRVKENVDENWKVVHAFLAEFKNK